MTGDAFGDRPTRAGDFRFDREGNRTRLASIAPGLAHSGLVSERLQGVLRSRSFRIESRYVHFLTAGRGGRISVVIDGFEKIQRADLRRADDGGEHRPGAALGDARRRDVARAFRLF